MTDEETEAKRRQDHPHNLKRSRNGDSYQWASPEHQESLWGLNILSQFPREIFEGTVGDFIRAGAVTILASQMQKASDVKITPSTKGDVRYRQYRLSNVNALFQRNGFLTTIDRLPLDCRIPVQDIYNLERKSVLDVETYCNYALYQWYRDHPHSYTFHSPAEDPSDDRYDAWLRTPAFYPLSIVPGFEPFVQDAEYVFRKIAGNTFHHTCIGVACGTKANYVVYHTKPVASKWNKSLEEDSRTKIARALSAAAGDDPYESPSKHDGYALMICPTVHQFKALFSSKRNGEHPKGRIDAPYQAISIVPLNHSGLEQIRRLMLSTPIIEEQIIANYLVDHFEDFTHTYDSLFPVTHQGIPVLLAHMMNFQKLFQAKQLYEKGHRFCISCFPQQVKFLRSIMPDAEYI